MVLRSANELGVYADGQLPFHLQAPYWQHDCMDYRKPCEEETMSEPRPHQPSQPEKRLEALALLKVLELGDRQIEVGQVQPAADVLARLRKRYQGD